MGPGDFCPAPLNAEQCSPTLAAFKATLGAKASQGSLVLMCGPGNGCAPIGVQRLKFPRRELSGVCSSRVDARKPLWLGPLP